MKNISQLLNSTEVVKKIDSNPTLLIDNPTKTKPKICPNLTNKIYRKRKASPITWTDELISNLKFKSIEYQKTASKR